MDPQSPSFVITGTGVPGPFAALVAYAPFWFSGGTDAVDIPGWGLGDLDTSYALIEARLNWLTDISGPAAIIGHSQGGYHAVRYALNNPKRAHTAIAISTPFGGLDATIRRRRRQLTKWTLGKPGGRMIARLGGHVWDSAEERVERFLHSKAPSLHSLAFLGGPLQELRHAVEERWDPTVKLVLIGGQKDKFVDIQDGTVWDLSIPNEEMCHKYYLGQEDPGNLPVGVRHWRSRRSGHLAEVLESELHKLVTKHIKPTHRQTVEPLKLPAA